jgi:hypothetical protein
MELAEIEMRGKTSGGRPASKQEIIAREARMEGGKERR